MKLLSLTRLTVLAAACAALSLGSGAAVASPITIFHADFEGSTAIDSNTGLTPNATVANLNAGTSVGSWALTNNTPGFVISNATGTDKAFAFDHGTGDVTSDDEATALFTQTVNIGTGDTMSFEFDIFAARSGGTNRRVAIRLRDDQGTVAYEINFRVGGGGFDRLIEYRRTNGNLNNVAGIDGPDFNNPSVDGYRDWSWAEDDGGVAGAMIRVRIDVLGQTTFSAESGALVSIDWNGNGTFDVVDAEIGARTLGVTSISQLHLAYEGGGTRGVWLDNIHATYIPEPASVVLVLTGSMLICLRRRR